MSINKYMIIIFSIIIIYLFNYKNFILDFIGKLVNHIHPKGFKVVRRYSLYTRLTIEQDLNNK